MARASIKENKSPYQTTRESLKLTRETASELLETFSPERIEKIENDRVLPHPDEVLVMAEKYTCTCVTVPIRMASAGLGSRPLPEN